MKNVLLLIHDDAGQEARLQAALDVTRALDGHLACLDVTIAPVMVDDYVPTGGSALLIAEEREREKANRAAVEARLAREGVPYDWRDVAGNLGACLRDAATLADVIVINRQLDHVHFPDMIALAGDLLVHAQTPVLAVPQQARGFDAAGAALVAWDGSQPAQEALQAAAPLLRLAREVTIVAIDNGTLRAPAEDAARYLARHGIEPLVRNVPAGREKASDLLLAELRSAGAAYLVMGGFGRSRMVEAMFGGVTRRLLANSPVPLLLAH